MRDIKNYMTMLDKSVFDSAAHLYETQVQLAENNGTWNQDLHYRHLQGTQQVADDMKHIMTVLLELNKKLDSIIEDQTK